MCDFEDCFKPVKAKGYCQTHYMQLRRRGKVSEVRIVNNPVARFWSKVEKGDDHWLWLPGSKDSHGYGQFSIGTKKIYPHRFSYEINIGPIPENLEIDHICRIRLCVNPNHLRAVTKAENALNRSDNLRVINGVLHCSKMHAIIGDNEYVRPNGRSECRVCINRPKRTSKNS